MLKFYTWREPNFRRVWSPFLLIESVLLRSYLLFATLLDTLFFQMASSCEFDCEVLRISGRDRDLTALAQVKGNMEVKCEVELDLSHQPEQAGSLEPLLNKG